MNRKTQNLPFKYMPQIIIFVVALLLILVILWVRYGGMTVDSALSKLEDFFKMLTSG